MREINTAPKHHLRLSKWHIVVGVFDVRDNIPTNTRKTNKLGWKFYILDTVKAADDCINW